MVAPSTPSAQSKVSSSSEAAQTAAATNLPRTADLKSIRLESASSPAAIKSIPVADIVDNDTVEMVVVDTPSVSPDIPTHPRTTANDTMATTEIRTIRGHLFDDVQPVVETTEFACAGHSIHSTEDNETKPFDAADIKTAVKLELAVSSIEPPVRSHHEGNVFIKKEYLPTSTNSIVKPEKTRAEVTRFLNFGHPDESACQSDATMPLGLLEALKANTVTSRLYRIPETSKDADMLKVAHKSAPTETGRVDCPKGDVKLTSHVKESSKSQSSSRRSSSSSNRDCSRCYKRSKIKRTHVGVQCSRTPSDCAPRPIDPLLEPTENCGAYPMRDLHCPPPDRPTPVLGLKYERFFHIEVHTNGGASVVHLYQDEINELSPEEMDELVDEFFAVAFSEDKDGSANHVMGIVHDAAGYLPDLLEHMSENYSTLTVKAGVMGRSSDIETSTMYQYNEQVCRVDGFLFECIEISLMHVRFVVVVAGCQKLFARNVPLWSAASNQFGWQGARRGGRLFSRPVGTTRGESIPQKGKAPSD